MLDAQDRDELEMALGELRRSFEFVQTSEAARSLKRGAMERLEKMLNRNPEVKEPVGGNVDRAVPEEPGQPIMGGLFDKRI
ncbi:MAG: hypothetical protein JWN50_290 [Parcubacteria group bacterium]|nr:hypothetical protein [Parcubacteria group bacterium]